MVTVSEIKKSILASLWFMFLTFPILVIRVNTIDNVIEWRWGRMAMVGVGSFVLSFLWRYMIQRRQTRSKQVAEGVRQTKPLVQRLMKERRITQPAVILVCLFILIIPQFFSWHATKLMTDVLIYVVLGLGLNIVVGLAGLLHLGYVAFFAVGAYTYGLLNYHFGLNFWLCLPLGAGMGALFGILLGFPVLRLRGDYLAIVTLAFGEIVRIVLENWGEFSFGPSGIKNIPPPALPGLHLTLQQSHVLIYYLMVAMVVFTILVVRRLQNSRVGRAWVALREDETACQAMGIDKTRTKLSAFALGSMWAGMAGVVFAAKQTFINPASFTIWESIMVLCIVVLGGMGSIVGVVIAATIMVILPESLKAFSSEVSNYRWVIFGAVLVLMMVFRPGGLISDVRKVYTFKSTNKGDR